MDKQPRVPSIYEEQTFDLEANRQGIHVDMAARAAGPTEADIDNMTPAEIKALTESWAHGVGSSFN